MKPIPNLFKFATKELSQDAFICWALAWADTSFSGSHPLLHRMGREFLGAMFSKHGLSLSKSVSVDIRQQMGGLDILVLVDDIYAVLIEDKINSNEHGNQLQNYLESTRIAHPNRKLLPIFAKTGDQSIYLKVIASGYQPFLRNDFLAALGKSDGVVHDAIFRDFLSTLKERDQRCNAYQQKPFHDWQANGDAWSGLYEHLQKLRADDSFAWKYVPNGSGGFMGAWWHFRDWGGSEVYLQIEEGLLCFKICPPLGVAKERANWRNAWHKHLLASSQTVELGLKRPDRFGNGECMTAAIIPRERWMKLNDAGYLEIDAMLDVLKKAEALIDFLILQKPFPDASTQLEPNPQLASV